MVIILQRIVDGLHLKRIVQIQDKNIKYLGETASEASRRLGGYPRLNIPKNKEIWLVNQESIYRKIKVYKKRTDKKQ